jgi:RNA polymerase sigma-B factor
MTATTAATAQASDVRRLRTDRARTLLLAAADALDPSVKRQLLDEVVTMHLPVADSMASRYDRRGVAHDDLVQVARLALVASAARFSLDHNRDFMEFAVPTISGELKKHFRDHAWTVRPPRRVQEAQSEISEARSRLSQALGREPSTAEVATDTGLDEETVIEALAARTCFSPDSLDRAADLDGNTMTLAERIGRVDQGFEEFERRAVLEPLLHNLSERDQLVLGLRFVENRTQAEIAAEIDVSQMQVSRILTRILRGLRDSLEDASSSGWHARHGALSDPGTARQ